MNMETDMSKNLYETLNKHLSTTESIDSEERSDNVSKNVKHNWFLYRGLSQMLAKSKTLRYIHIVD